MTNYWERRTWSFFVLLALSIAVLVSATVLGIVSFMTVSIGETANAWYLVGAASVAILLLPFVATPLTWVAVELLMQRARASAEAATDTADTELQPREGSSPPPRQNASVSSSSDCAQSEHVTEGELPNSPTAESTIVTIERMSPPAKTNENNSKTAGKNDGQGLHNVSRLGKTDSVRAIGRRSADVPTEEGQFLEVEIYDVQHNRVDHSKFQSMNKAACAMMYAALMCFSLSLMCLMWNIFIGVCYNSQQDYFWHTIICNVVLNILCPAFAIFGLLLFLQVVMYTSAGQIDFRVILSYMLASVKLVNGEVVHPTRLTFRYWMIGEFFYIRLRTPRGNPKQLRYYIDRTPATYFLAAIVVIAFTLSAWLCLEALLLETLTITTPVIDDDFSGDTCVHGLTTLSHTDVLNVNDTRTLNCVLFRIQFNIYHSSTELITAILVYIGAVQLLKFIVTTVSILLLVHHSKIWGLVLLICHILLFIAVLVIVTVMDSIAAHTKAKLTALAILFLPMDFLLLSGGVREVIQEPQRTRGIMVRPKQYFDGLQHMNTLEDVSSPQSETV